MKHFTFVALALLAFSLGLSACAPSASAAISAPTLAPTVPSTVSVTSTPENSSTATPASPVLNLDALQNATYHSNDFGDFQLSAGVYYYPPLPGETESKSITQLTEPFALGDLNADDLEDAAIILKTQTGGSGIFVELAAALNQTGHPQNVSTVALGDRVIINAIHIQAGVIQLEMVVQGPTDPMCCPTQVETWTFQLVDDQLVRQP